MRDAFSKTVINCKQSTTVSGTTPSGCTQRAPTGLRNPVDQSTDRKIDIIKPKADCQQSTLALGTTPSGCTQRAPANTEFIRHTQWVTAINSGKEKFFGSISNRTNNGRLTWTLLWRAELAS